jgi:selenocysteine insertion sequence-binding protein 2
VLVGQQREYSRFTVTVTTFLRWKKRIVNSSIEPASVHPLLGLPLHLYFLIRLMSSYADAAKRIAAASSVEVEKQRKKQKTELPSDHSRTPKNDSPHQHQQVPSQSKSQTSDAATSGKHAVISQVKQSGKETANKKKNQKSNKKKPTLKTMSLGDMFTGNIVKGQPHPKAQKWQQKFGSMKQKKKSPQTLQSSDFPSLTASQYPPLSQPSSSSTPQTKPAVVILKRSGQPMPAPKTSSATKPKESVNAVPASVSPSKSSLNIGGSDRPASHAEESEKRSSLAASLLGARTERTRDHDGGEHDLLRLMSQGMVVQNKGRQRVRPRKKKYSSLKKKVLEERLRHWKELNPDAHSSDEASTREIPSIFCTVCVYGLAEPDLLEDDDEFEELLSNIEDMAGQLGKHKRIYLPRNITGRTSSSYPCFVEFETAKLVQAALSCWNGLSLGGETLQATSIPLATELPETIEWESRCIEAEASIKEAHPGDADPEGVSSAIALLNILNDDDLEDDDCLEETVGDMRRIGEEFGAIEGASVDRDQKSVILVYRGGRELALHAIAELGKKIVSGIPINAVLVDAAVDKPEGRITLRNVLTDDDLEDEDCLQETVSDIRRLGEEFGVVTDVLIEKDQRNTVIVYGGGITVAKRAAEELRKKIIGGSLVDVTVHEVKRPESREGLHSIILKGALTEDDMDDKECLEESLADLKELAKRFGSVTSVSVLGETVKVSFSKASEAAAAVSGFHGMVIGGQIIGSCIDVESDREIGISVDVEMQAAPAPDPPTDEIFSGDKRIPERFAECLRVPKVAVPAGPRKYATLLNDESVKPLIIEMLGELMRLQKRAIDDKNAKARRRLVMGFREVARGVRARKVKLVIMANNLDDQYGAIDEKLQEILDLCHTEGVPVIFELNKKGIGKALGKTIKVAVVG